MNASGLQTALYQALIADAGLLAMLSTEWGVTAVFSDTPDTAEDENAGYYPFISFGPDETGPFDDKDTLGGNASIQVNVWTQDGDYIAAKTIGDRIHQTLTRQPLSITGSTHIATEFVSAGYTKDPDGKTRRGLLIFTVLYQ